MGATTAASQRQSDLPDQKEQRSREAPSSRCGIDAVHVVVIEERAHRDSRKRKKPQKHHRPPGAETDGQDW
jgi:hypothetical protein